MTFHQFIEDGPGWETLKSEQQFANPYLQVQAVEVRTPSRPGGCKWTVVHRKGATVIAPMLADGRFVLVKQERVPIRATIWEFPAGQIDGGSEQDAAVVREAALRELREESGYEPGADGELVPLGLFFSSCGFTDEHAHLFLARNVVPAALGRSPDEQEAITGCEIFTREELRAMIASGEIRDANTLAAYARMCAMGIL